MSVVVAKKTKNGFMIGCDSQCTQGQVKGKATKIFRVKSNEEIVCGVVGSLRDLNIFATLETLFSSEATRREIIDLEHIITNVVKKLKDKLKEEGRLLLEKGEGECMASAIMIAYKDKCWVIESDFAVTEVDDFDAIGAPSEFATGAYEMLADNKEMADEEKVLKIIKATIKRTIYVDYPIYIATTDGKRIKEIKKG